MQFHAGDGQQPSELLVLDHGFAQQPIDRRKVLAARADRFRAGAAPPQDAHPLEAAVDSTRRALCARTDRLPDMTGSKGAGDCMDLVVQACAVTINL